MKTIWDILKSFNKKENLSSNNVFMIIREEYFGEKYELTEKGIKNYYENEIKSEFNIISIKEKNDSYHVVIKIKDLSSDISSIGCSVVEFGDDLEKSFSLAVNRALINGMRSLLTLEKELYLIEKYFKSGNYIRIPKESEKIKLFKTRRNLTFVNQAG